MGFGFLTRIQQVLDMQVNGIGYVSADTRDYVLNMSAVNLNAMVSVVYEADNTGGAPDQKISSSVVNISALFNGIVQVSDAEAAIPAQYVSLPTAKIGATRGLRYTVVTVTPVVPTLKHIKWVIHNPERIKHFAIFGGGASSQGNCIQVTDFNFPFFPNLKTIFIKAAQTAAPVGANFVNFKGRFPETLEAFAYFFYSGVRMQTIEKAFPPSLKNLLIANNYAALGADIPRLIAACVNLESLILNDENWTNSDPNANANTPYTGNLDIQHIPAWKYFSIHNATALTGVLHNLTDVNIKRLRVTTCTAIDGTNFLGLINLLLNSNAGEYLSVANCTKTISRNFVNADFKSTLTQFYIFNNKITGSITLSTAKPNITNFQLGSDTVIADASKHNFATVDVSGLTNVASLDLSNSQIVTLTLPSSSVLTELVLGGNKLSITTNPGLIAAINALTNLINLNLATSTATSVGTNIGQNSADGFGNNLTLTPAGLIYLIANSCKLTGTLTVPSGMQTVIAPDNDLVALQGPSGGNLNSLVTLRIFSNPNANFNFAKFPNVVSLDYKNSLNTLIDLSGKTTTTVNTLSTINNNNNLTEIRLPSDATKCIFNAAANIHSWANNPSLSSILNIDKMGYTSNNSQRDFIASGCSLNMDFKFAVRDSFLPTRIQIQNNGMSQANVDANINNIWVNRGKWATAGLSAARSLNIGGTNAHPGPTAITQINDLVTNYGWTISYTP